jgi:hypothetical protein
VDQFHRVGCREWKKSREHLIQGDTKRVEIAAGIDRSIHPAGLLGCHIGEGAADGFGRIGSLALARKMRCDAKARQPDFARRIHHHVARLDVLVDQATLMQTPQRGGQSDSQAKEFSDFHRRAEGSLERLAAGVFEQQDGLTALAKKFQRPYGPRIVQLVP